VQEIAVLNFNNAIRATPSNFFNAAGESCKIKIRQMGSFDRRLMNKLFVLRAQGEVGARQVLPRQIFHFGCLRGGSIAGAFQ
jgi:hypothetical protein